MGESRTELLAWLNDLLQLNYTKVEQAGTGTFFFFSKTFMLDELLIPRHFLIKNRRCLLPSHGQYIQ